jgi:hypothetical protein
MANNFEDGQGSQRAVVPVMMMMMMMMMMMIVPMACYENSFTFYVNDVCTSQKTRVWTSTA